MLPVIKTVSGAIKIVEAAIICANPDIIVVINTQRPNPVIRQRPGFAVVMLIGNDFVAIIAIQSFLCRNPHEPEFILDDIRDAGMRQTVLRSQVLKSNIARCLSRMTQQQAKSNQH